MVPIGIAGVAYDLGGRNVLEPILTEAEQRGHEVHRVFPETRGVIELQREVLERCQALLIGGPSSNHPEEEVERARLFKNANPNGKIFVVEDSHGTSWRVKEDFARRTDGAVVALPTRIDLALTHGYPEVVHFGVPSHWKVSYDEILSGGELQQVPKKKGQKECGVVGDGDTVVAVSGGKSLSTVFNDVLERVCSDGRELLGDQLVIAVDAHPREECSSQEQEHRQDIVRNTWTIPRDPSRKGTHLVGYADATIFAGAVGPTASMTGAIARRPMIYYQDHRVEQELLRQLGVSHWWVEELGGVWAVEHTADIRGALSFLLSSDGHAAIRISQERHFPIPESWEDYPRKVVDYVERKLSGAVS